MFCVFCNSVHRIVCKCRPVEVNAKRRDAPSSDPFFGPLSSLLCFASARHALLDSVRVYRAQRSKKCGAHLQPLQGSAGSFMPRQLLEYRIRQPKKKERDLIKLFWKSPNYGRWFLRRMKKARVPHLMHRYIDLPRNSLYFQ